MSPFYRRNAGGVSYSSSHSGAFVRKGICWTQVCSNVGRYKYQSCPTTTTSSSRWCLPFILSNKQSPSNTFFSRRILDMAAESSGRISNNDNYRPAASATKRPLRNVLLRLREAYSHSGICAIESLNHMHNSMDLRKPREHI